MATSTRSRVWGITLGLPLDTRDIVCAETPASRATSAMETLTPRRDPGAAPALSAMSTIPVLSAGTGRCVHRFLRTIVHSVNRAVRRSSGTSNGAQQDRDGIETGPEVLTVIERRRRGQGLTRGDRGREADVQGRHRTRPGPRHR